MLDDEEDLLPFASQEPPATWLKRAQVRIVAIDRAAPEQDILTPADPVSSSQSSSSSSSSSSSASAEVVQSTAGKDRGESWHWLDESPETRETLRSYEDQLHQPERTLLPCEPTYGATLVPPQGEESESSELKLLGSRQERGQDKRVFTEQRYVSVLQTAENCDEIAGELWLCQQELMAQVRINNQRKIALRLIGEQQGHFLEAQQRYASMCPVLLAVPISVFFRQTHGSLTLKHITSI